MTTIHTQFHYSMTSLLSAPFCHGQASQWTGYHRFLDLQRE